MIRRMALLLCICLVVALFAPPRSEVEAAGVVQLEATTADTLDAGEALGFVHLRSTNGLAFGVRFLGGPLGDSAGAGVDDSVEVDAGDSMNMPLLEYGRATRLIAIYPQGGDTIKGFGM